MVGKYDEIAYRLRVENGLTESDRASWGFFRKLHFGRNFSSRNPP